MNFTMPLEKLFCYVNACAVSVARRPEQAAHLHFIFFEARDGRVRIASTDGHRATKADTKQDVSVTQEGRAALPERQIKAFRFALDALRDRAKNISDFVEVRREGEELKIGLDGDLRTYAVTCDIADPPPFDNVMRRPSSSSYDRSRPASTAFALEYIADVSTIAKISNAYTKGSVGANLEPLRRNLKAALAEERKIKADAKNYVKSQLDDARERGATKAEIKTLSAQYKIQHDKEVQRGAQIAYVAIMALEEAKRKNRAHGIKMLLSGELDPIHFSFSDPDLEHTLMPMRV